MKDAHAYNLTADYVYEDCRKDALAKLREVVPVCFRRKEPRRRKLKPQRMPLYRVRQDGELEQSPTLLYECGGDFRCVHCGSMTDVADGGADLLPFGCSGCWAKAHAALCDMGASAA